MEYIKYVLVFFAIILMFTIYSQFNEAKEQKELDKLHESMVQLRQEKIDIEGQYLVTYIQLQKAERLLDEENIKIKEQEEKFLMISKDDIDLLSRVMYAEARGSEKSMKYVGEVVLNRIEAGGYGSTIKEVIYQKGQFAVIRDGQINLKPSESAIKIATQLILGDRELPKNVLAFRASRYHKGKDYINYCEVANTYFSIVR